MKNATSINVNKGMYDKFCQINGIHPLASKVPDSCVLYQARKRKNGKVTYFNFNLAKSMGLIPEDHQEKITNELDQIILDTFSIIIINEYDINHKIKFKEEEILPNKYMATRYLQLQHPNKQGKTSGDGRSIWNGTIHHMGKVWDISSCGTGATCLSPATSINNKFYQSGDPSISYGCGFSEIDEGYNTLFFSEILKKNGIETEQVLALIRYPNGMSITVRAHSNLLRPSHFFRYIKQGDDKNLEKLLDYYVDREIENKSWGPKPTSEKEKYNQFMHNITKTFARTTATFEDEYIFCWLDWDGDNILMDGGIIDYGSVRQFGLFHHNYRFDDDARFSTTITEQKLKAKYIIQTFAQGIDFILSKSKKKINIFKHDKYQKLFDQTFKQYKNRNILKKIGFNSNQQDILLEHNLKDVLKFRNAFSYFEKAKTKEGPAKLPDGITWSVIFCMRDILRELPQLYLCDEKNILPEEFIDISKSSYATEDDLYLNSYRQEKINLFQHQYWKLIRAIAEKTNTTPNKVLIELTMRSSVINKYYRVTGDAIGNIVDTVLKQSPRLAPEELEDLLHFIVHQQQFNPDDISSVIEHKKHENYKIKNRILTLVKDFREGI